MAVQAVAVPTIHIGDQEYDVVDFRREGEDVYWNELERRAKAEHAMLGETEGLKFLQGEHEEHHDKLFIFPNWVNPASRSVACVSWDKSSTCWVKSWLFIDGGGRKTIRFGGNLRLLRPR